MSHQVGCVGVVRVTTFVGRGGVPKIQLTGDWDALPGVIEIAADEIPKLIEILVVALIKPEG